jgi:hypothetical protein
MGLLRLLLINAESSQPLIPAEAGIQSWPNKKSFRRSPFCPLLDSRLRGNERSFG